MSLNNKIMKNLNIFLVTFFVLALYSYDTQAQTWTASGGELYLNPSSSRVGIGITNPSNSYKLHVSGGTTTSAIYGYTGSTSTTRYGVRGYARNGRGVYGQTYLGYGLYGYSSSTSGHAGFFSGKVQITRGDLRGKDGNKDFIIKCSTANDEAGPYFHMYGSDFGTTSRRGDISIVYGGLVNNGDIRFTHYNGTTWTTNAQINHQGKMSIGTTSTPTFVGGANISAYRLFVRGGILTEEVRVRTGWADYVFADDYQLTALPQVEKHIQDKGHLHNTPSAAQVEAEGIELGDITVNQQEKIEEIFLHLIDLNKKLEKLEKENAALKQEISELKK